MKKKSISFAHVFPALLLCLLCLIPTAHADIGPKPEVTIQVVNAPEGEIYLDLLAEGSAAASPYPNSFDGCDPVILGNLRSLEGDGWVLAYSTGVSNSPPSLATYALGRTAPGATPMWDCPTHFALPLPPPTRPKRQRRPTPESTFPTSSMTGRPTPCVRPRPLPCVLRSG